ncbi:ring-cleaving dioxygenase [Oceanobacillus rekensis]|uniref:ring-cleaving dioxygenase n=1 Tax=Oceanobacillus rekensis TaxID=937927 RepID=UPI000B4429DA|nr:ring-cleaving dioxygenase [Oceanobacillus rekensis]
MEIIGIHHVSAITKNAKDNFHFYTEVLGMRLVKKTVNQDDTSMYHLFYADEAGNPGTDLTFFEIPNAGATHPGVGSISSTSLRVPDNKALEYWQERLTNHNVDHDGITMQGERKVIHFRDPEQQRLTLVSDENNSGVAGGKVWDRSPVPIDKGIIGLGPSKLTVRKPEPTVNILTKLLTFKQVGSYPSDIANQPDILVFSTGDGGTGAEVHLEERKDLPQERPGRGSVHHVAFRVKDREELTKWKDRLEEIQLPNSGMVDRFYFRSLYFRDPNGIMFELATDGPGFVTDEEFEDLGESLALPPYLEGQRKKIEAIIEPLETKRSH